MTAVSVLNLFVQTVLLPAGSLLDHIKAFVLLRDMLSILQTGDDAVSRVGDLELIIEAHHIEFARLYPDLEKPKIHYLKHVPTCFRKFKVNMSCFGAERKHKELSDRYGEHQPT